MKRQTLLYLRRIRQRTPAINSSSTRLVSHNTAAVGTDTPESSVNSFVQRAQGLLEESSGLKELMRLKDAVQEASEKFDQATKQVSECRDQVAHAQKAHDLAHKKHVSILMRREEWSADDAQSFVTITSEEVGTRQALLDAQDSLRRAEDSAIQCQHAYMDVMRQRYHEEQIWQEKWRLLGTYGTWSLIGVNTMVFLLSQYKMEQRERKRIKHMENLFIKSQKEATIAKASFIEEEEKHIEETKQDETQTQEDGHVPEDESLPVRSDDSKIPHVLRNIPLHTPSLALGAALSASCVILVTLLNSRR